MSKEKKIREKKKPLFIEAISMIVVSVSYTHLGAGDGPNHVIQQVSPDGNKQGRYGQNKVKCQRHSQNPCIF